MATTMFVTRPRVISVYEDDFAVQAYSNIFAVQAYFNKISLVHAEENERLQF